MISKERLNPYRATLPHLENGHIYLNHAAFGVLSTKVNAHINTHLTERSSGVIESFMIDMDIIEETRSKIARLINAPSSDQIAFVTNTSEGINLVAGGINWRKGDSILLNDIEFPSNVYPYMNLQHRGVDVRFAKSNRGVVTANQLEQSIADSDQLVGISAVQFLSGYRIDLRKLGQICVDRDKWLVVDGIQAAGNSPIDVQAMQIDAFISGGLKWLMAPMGIGFVYFSEDMLNTLRPHHVGWLSVETPWDLFNYEQGLNATARRYELGGLNVPGIYALHASLDPFLELDVAKIHKHVVSLNQHIIEKMDIPGVKLYTEGSFEERSGIVTFRLPAGSEGDAFIEMLKKHNVTISHRHNMLRFSPHFYNNIADIDMAMVTVNRLGRDFF